MWQHDTKRAAFVYATFDLNVALMCFDKRLGQTETQSISAGRAAPISTIKSVKDMGKVVFFDPYSVVCHGNFYVSRFVFNGDENAAAGSGVFERIIDQIGQNTLEFPLIACVDDTT